MATPVNYTERTRSETPLHYLAREGRVVLRWTMVVCIVAIILCMVSPGFYFLSVVPAIFLLGSYALLVFTNVAERRTTDDSAEEGELTSGAVDVIEDHAEDHQMQPENAHIVKRQTRVGLIILGIALLVGLGVAAIFLPGRVIAIGAFVVFAYVLFISLPVLLGWFNDDVDMETHRLNDEPQSAQARTNETL